MLPHTDNFYNPLIFNSFFLEGFIINLIDEFMLDINPPRKKSGEISYKGFISWRSCKRIVSDNIYKTFRLS